MFPVRRSSPTAALPGPVGSLHAAASLIQQQHLPPCRLSGQYPGLGSKMPDPKFPAPTRFAACSCRTGRCDRDGGSLGGSARSQQGCAGVRSNSWGIAGRLGCAALAPGMEEPRVMPSPFCRWGRRQCPAWSHTPGTRSTTVLTSPFPMSTSTCTQPSRGGLYEMNLLGLSLACGSLGSLLIFAPWEIRGNEGCDECTGFYGPARSSCPPGLLSEPILCALPLLQCSFSSSSSLFSCLPQQGAALPCKSCPQCTQGLSAARLERGGDLSLSRQLEIKGAERQVRLWAVHTIHPQSSSGASPLVLLCLCAFPTGTSNCGSPITPVLPGWSGLWFPPCLSLPSGRGAG